MSHTIRRFVIASAICTAVSGCAVPRDELCPDHDDNTDSVTLGISGAPTFELGDESVEIRGTAHHELGYAIRRVVVAGFDARSESDSFNFGAWTATVPGAVIENMLEPGQADVTLTVEVFEPCNDEKAAATGMAVVHVEAPPP